MGKFFTDEYSLLHFATGIIAYFWGIRLIDYTMIHIVFELLENTQNGMYIINNWFAGIWPGGKDESDTYINSIGDVVYGAIGWLLAYYICKLKI